MTSNSRIPQHVAPYVEDVPKDNLILLTGTLSNSINWLLVRYLIAALGKDAGLKARRTEGGNGGEDVGVVLVSWMRDFEFWKTEVRRSGGIDLTSLSQSKNFVYVDGLSASTPQLKTSPSAGTQPTRTQLPARTPPATSNALPARGSHATSGRTTATSTTTAALPAQTPAKAELSAQSISSLEFDHVQKSIETALASLSAPTALLILDAPDILLALQDPASTTNTSPSTALQSLILSLRLNPRVHATIVSMASDMNPLPSAFRNEQHTPTPLETESQAFMVGVAHTADLVVSARGLDTGAAGDVGGVLRVSVPGKADEDDEEPASKPEWKEQELLYLVKTDGSAKVWERGAGVGVG